MHIYIDTYILRHELDHISSLAKCPMVLLHSKTSKLYIYMCSLLEPHINHIFSIAWGCGIAEDLDLWIESLIIMGGNIIDVSSGKVDCIPGQLATTSQESV